MNTRPSAKLNPSPRAALQAPTSPFPGLRPFKYAESQLFFGRDGQVEQMLTKLAATRFLAVVGTSGSGKSSLACAGMLPALSSGMLPGAGSNWRLAILRPGSAPISNLTQVLSQPGVFSSDDPAEAEWQAAITSATLWRGSRGLRETVQQNALPPGENLLILVDQFEEIFRFAREARRTGNQKYSDEAAAFVKLLLEAVKPNADGQHELNIYVVLTMRSDFLGDCAQFFGLPEAINASQYLIPRLTREQLREAITGPITLCGGAISTRLVNQLLNDIADNQDQLPILQHALMRMWDHWLAACSLPVAKAAASQPLDLVHYEAIGGLAKALSRHAEEAFADLPDKDAKPLAAKLFKALTEKGADNREIRRPATLAELAEITGASASELSAVIEVFRRPGRSFVMPPIPAELNGQALIDISHESLIRNWGRLQSWVEDEARSARIYRRLAETAALHARQEAGLWRDPDLQIALDWQTREQPNAAWAQRYQPDFAAAVSFLAQSRAQREKERDELERERRAKLQRTRRFVTVLLVAFLISLGLALYSFKQKRQADAAREEAVKSQQKAEDSARSDRLNNQVIPILTTLLTKNASREALESSLTVYRASEDALGQAVVQTNLGDYYNRTGEFSLALECFEAAEQLLKGWERHPYTARVLRRLGQTYFRLNQLARGQEHFRNAKEQLARTFGSESQEVALLLTQRGEVYVELGRSAEAQGTEARNYFAEAEKDYREALRIDLIVLGPVHPQVALDQNQLAALLAEQDSQRHFKEASELFEKARQTLEQDRNRHSQAKAATDLQLSTAAELSDKLASIYGNYGALLASQPNRHAEAELYLKQALGLHQKLGEPESVAFDLNNLARFYLDQGKGTPAAQTKAAAAEPLLKQALEIFKRSPSIQAEAIQAVSDSLKEAQEMLSNSLSKEAKARARNTRK